MLLHTEASAFVPKYSSVSFLCLDGSSSTSSTQLLLSQTKAWALVLLIHCSYEVASDVLLWPRYLRTRSPWLLPRAFQQEVQAKGMAHAVWMWMWTWVWVWV